MLGVVCGEADLFPPSLDIILQPFMWPITEPLVRYRAALDEGPLTFLSTLKKAVRKLVILSPRVQQLEFKGQRMVISVFEAFSSDPEALLPRHGDACS